MQEWIRVFAFIGMMGTLATLFALCGMFLMFVYEKIRDLQRRYECKHRFDKPPTANCFCKDCIYHEEDDYCGYVRQKTPEDGFCYRSKINE